MNHQDFKEIMFRKKKQFEPKSHYEKTISKRLDEEHDELKHNTVGVSMANKIRNARLAKHFLTQKDLANHMNEPVDKIKSYENGKAIPDHAMLQKLRRHLNVNI